MSATPIILLPVEILVYIAREVRPQDLKNFVLTCRVVYSASEDALKEYRGLRKQYRHVGNFIREQRSSACHYLAELLHRMLESPKVASHVEHFSYREDKRDEYRAADYKQSFQDSLENLQLNNSERETWWSDTSQNRYKPRANQLMLGLLLHNLPNLEAFEWHSVENALDLASLLQPTQLHQAGLRPPLLPFLKKVWLSAGRFGAYVGDIPLKQVLPFLALPMIEYLDIQRFKCLDPPDDLDIAAVPPRSSSLRELVLSMSCLGKNLDHLLQLPRSLTKLNFVCPASDDESREVFPLGPAKQYHLERLKIRMVFWTHHIDRNALPLHTELQYLETSCFLIDDATLTPASDIKHYFPPSVRHIVFADSDLETQKDYFRYFQQILELRRAKILPHLKRLTLRSEAIRITRFNRKVKATRKAGKALGIEFDVDVDWPRYTIGLHPRDRRPVSWWRRSHDGYSSADTDPVGCREPISEDV
ncbi:MAG: hypothetical protein OHK93_006848 [Ramalina farinacea]|uniref:F-box domain-containing protein n=1 Tax=Ramalina farinacea TaxID=258253 RepID=A0AA43TTH3_9LECA|nr:hypothetical protein [Ramalina farinacea]